MQGHFRDQRVIVRPAGEPYVEHDERWTYLYVVDTETTQDDEGAEALCAYLTGMFGDRWSPLTEALEFYTDLGLTNEAGQTMAEDCEEGELFEALLDAPRKFKNPFADLLQTLERGDAATHCAVWQTPGWFNIDWVGVNFQDDQEEAAQRAIDVMIAEGKQLGYGEPPDLDEWRKLANRRRPAFLSVAIFFKSMPEPKITELLDTRAAKFCAEAGWKLAGTRLLKETVILTTLQEFKPGESP